MRAWSGDKPLPILYDQPLAEYSEHDMRMQWLGDTLAGV
jgi:hypothetical protein